jgi:hypothetical protein
MIPSKQQREQEFLDKLEKWCKANPVSFYHVTDYQIRVTKGTRKLDLFPKTGKYHDIGSNKRGFVEERVAEFLDKFFNW